MTKLRNSLVLAAAAALLCLPTSAAADTTVKAKLVEVNDSGVSGTATLTALDDGGLKVVIRARGPRAGRVPRPAHSRDRTRGALQVPHPEGQRHRWRRSSHQRGGDGRVRRHLLSVDNQWWCDAEDALAADRLPVADSKGRLNYERTFPAEMIPDGLLDHLSELHVVQHGIDVNNNGKYDVEALGDLDVRRERRESPVYRKRSPIRLPAASSRGPAQRIRRAAAWRPAVSRRLS